MEKKRCYGCMQLKTQEICEHCGYDENTVNAPHQLPVGTILQGQYLVGKVLGEGGFGITYLGWDQFLEIPVAIKEYYPGSFVTRECSTTLNVTCYTGSVTAQYQSNMNRFLREAQTLAKFSDVPEIVHVRNFFRANNTAYIIMEYVKGIDLRRYINMRGGRLPAQELLQIMKPVMEALSKVHEAGLIHRDISPDNIMMLPNGSAKLLDFGAARDVENADVDKELPKSTEAILKHGFAPMEQYQKRGALGPWTDVYALCATIYYCNTGKLPADAPNRMMEEEDIDWSRLNGMADSQVAALQKGMALRAKDRFASVQELYEALYNGHASVGASTGTQESFQNTSGSRGDSYANTTPVSRPDDFVPGGAGGYRQSGTGAQVIGNSGSWQAAAVADVIPRTVRGGGQQAARVEEKPSILKNQTLNLVAVALSILLMVVSFVVPAISKAAAGSDDGGTTVNFPTTSGSSTSNDSAPAAAAADYSGNVMKFYEMPDWSDREELYASAAFGMDIPRGDIYQVVFLDSLSSAPSNAWDVSEAGNGSVKAWAESGTLYIGAEGGVNGRDTCAYMFYGFHNLTTVQFNGAFHTEEAQSMRGMFNMCESLTNIDIASLDTSSVQLMDYLFYECSSLVRLDLRNFDTSNVENMTSMFDGCSSLESVDVSSFDTAKVTDMFAMFFGCASLQKLDLSNFNTANVTDMAFMFTNCWMLESLNVSSFNTAKVTDMCYMFDDCSSLTSLDVTGFNTANVTDMCNMFYGCESLSELDLTSFETHNVTDMSYMLYGTRDDCYVTLDTDKFDTSNVENYTCFDQDAWDWESILFS